MMAIIRNSTVSNNSTGSGGRGPAGDGVQGNGGGLYFGSKAVIKNSIIWNNETANQIASSSEISYTNIDGDYLGIGNISLDPLFANPSTGDFHLRSEYGRWDPALQSWVFDDVTSPCIDAGDPRDDGWKKELWPHGKRINMGAYGGTPEASMSASDTGNIADMNNDEIVNMEDFAIFAADWHQVLAPVPLIPHGTVVLDGDLSDWPATVQWTSLDKVYDGHPTDVTAASFALLWSDDSNKVYVAVKINDTSHVFSDEYGSWNASDRVEIYCQGTGKGGADFRYVYDIAQQYYIAPDGTGGSWATWANGDAVTDVALEKAVTIQGNELIYEIAVPAFDSYGSYKGEETFATDLAQGTKIGFDVTVLTRSQDGGYGMLAQNLMTGKSNDASAFARYVLAKAVHPIASMPSMTDLDRNSRVDFSDLTILGDCWLDHHGGTIEAGLVGHWRFEEYSGTTVMDSSPYANNGLLMNGPQWTTGQGPCLSFDGVNDCVDCGTGSSLNLTGDLTVTSWIYLENYGLIGDARIVDKGDAPAGFVFYLKDGLHSLAYQAGAAEVVSDSEAIRLNEWQHVAVSYSSASGTVTFYVNGQTAGIVTNYQTDPVDSADAPLIIGNTASLGRGFEGMLSDVRLYNRALTAEEIDLIFRTHEVHENKPFAFQLAATDINGAPYTYVLQAGQTLSSGATFTDGFFSWRPWYNQSGTYNLTFEVPGQPDLTQAVSIVVDDVPLANWYRLWLESIDKY